MARIDLALVHDDGEQIVDLRWRVVELLAGRRVVRRHVEPRREADASVDLARGAAVLEALTISRAAERSRTLSWMQSTGAKLRIESCLLAGSVASPQRSQVYCLGASRSGAV